MNDFHKTLLIKNPLYDIEPNKSTNIFIGYNGYFSFIRYNRYYWLIIQL